MSYTRVRRARALLMLACALVQPAFSSALLASAVTLALHGRAHAHSVALIADDGHVDLVLSHTERRSDDGCREAIHVHEHLSHGESDHVLHVASDDVTRTPSRKFSVDPAPAIEAPRAIPVEPASWTALRALARPPVRGTHQIRTVVLQL